MSFTEQVKNELARIQRDDRDCRVAELLALLRMSGSFITGGHGRWGLEFSTGNSCAPRPRLSEEGFRPHAFHDGAAGEKTPQEECLHACRAAFR